MYNNLFVILVCDMLVYKFTVFWLEVELMIFFVVDKKVDWRKNKEVNDLDAIRYW